MIKINKIPQDKSTGNDKTPKIAVISKAQTVRGKRFMLIPLVLRFNTVTI